MGRDAELGAIDRLLGALHEGPAILVLEGEAGIGKTTLLRAAIEEGHRRQLRVLKCAAAAASEARLSYMSLADLLVGVSDAEGPRLAPAQRAALDAALGDRRRAMA